MVSSVLFFALLTAGFATEAGAVKPIVPENQKKTVILQEQVYLDPSQVEAAQKQIEADAFYNAQPQIKVSESVSEKNAVKEETEEEAKPTVAMKSKEENTEAAQHRIVMPQEQIYLDESQAEAAKKQKEADAFYNAELQTKMEPGAGSIQVQETEPVKIAEPVKEAVPDKLEKPAQVAGPVKEAEPVKDMEAEKEAVPDKLEKPVQVAGPVNEAEPVKDMETAKEAVPDKLEKPVQVSAPMQKAEQVSLSGQKPVQLRRMGVTREVMTHHATVADVLKDLNVNLEGRSVYPAPETGIKEGMVIHVLGRKSFVSHEEEEVPFQTRVIDDPELAFGTKQVDKAGIKGKDIVTYENITRIGYEQKIELDRRHIVAPVNEIVRQGVAQSVLTPDGYKRYKRKIYGEATAYTWGGGASGTTSLGLWPKRGIVAVDPRVIPYYTKMYIPGYGMAVAGDTGGAIVGVRIDLFMDSLYECYQWGRRDVEIYILE